MTSQPNPFAASARWNTPQQAAPWQAAPSSEQQRLAFLGGPLFKLQKSVDKSQVETNGKLVRSERLARLEAVLLISRSALPSRKLAQHAGLVDGKEAEQLIQLLNNSYDLTNSAFRVESTATGFLLMTRPVLVTWLDRIHPRQAEMRLSPPMMETLTIIGYQQPITRARVEAVRGVQSAEMIRQLIDRGLVKVGGEEDSLGRPFLYITTRAFLDMFGLGRVEDLPDYDSIGRPPESAKISSEENNSEAEATDEASELTTEQDSPEDQQAA